MRRKGARFEQIADELGISLTSLKNYRKKHKELAKVLADEEFNLHKALANIAEDSLFTKLEDRFITSETITDTRTDEEGNETTHTIEKKRFIPADTTAIIFALKQLVFTLMQTF